MSSFIECFQSPLKDYLLDPFKAIQGGCDARIFYSLQIMLKAQVTICPSSNQDECEKKRIAEIGVRDGRFFIGILKMLPPDSTGLAIDLFDQQQHNIDGSGWRPASHGLPFFDNIRAYVENPERIICKKTDSLDLSIADIVDIGTQYGPFHIFSIDGGHEAEHLINDLTIAELTVKHNAFVLLDDYYNPNYPGVHEGFAAYMSQKRKMVPILYSAGKLYLCTKTCYRRYLNFLSKTLPEIRETSNYSKWTRMFGYEVLHIQM